MNEVATIKDKDTIRNMRIEKVENGYIVNLRDDDYKSKDFIYLTLAEALAKVTEVYGQ